MFVLSLIKDTVAIQPAYFAVPPEQAIISELNKKYANRVLHDVGLCICVFDIAQAGEGKVRYGDGCLWYKVVFREVVFRPFTSEVILAKVKSSDEDGIRLTVGFFDDIYVPLMYLPTPSAFDPNERAHFWLPSYEPPESDPEHIPTQHELMDFPTSQRMYIDNNEIIRVRVEADEFFDDEPGPPKAGEGGIMQPKAERKRAPYNIVCSIAEQGLGPLQWWNANQDDTEDAMEEG